MYHLNGSSRNQHQQPNVLTKENIINHILRLCQLIAAGELVRIKKCMSLISSFLFLRIPLYLSKLVKGIQLCLNNIEVYIIILSRDRFCNRICQ